MYSKRCRIEIAEGRSIEDRAPHSPFRVPHSAYPPVRCARFRILSHVSRAILPALVIAFSAFAALSQSFPLVTKSDAAPILFDESDFPVVRIAANDFADDVERVTGRHPAFNGSAKHVVIVGTIGRSSLIARLGGRLDAGRIAGKRECFIIRTIKNPLPGVESALVIAGSDRRGTAFGVYEMSRRIGVSPWVFWADAVPAKKDELAVPPTNFASEPPSVKFRGIFLNDEDWGLEPWARKNFEPENGTIGPKTYAKVFELLLRLKANTLWPAMHEVTKPFNADPRNARLADDYAIVMGSSHAEPMLRNNVGEWKDAKEKYNFLTNEAGVTAYWDERAKSNAAFENVWTIGMRGIHDSSIQGPKTPAERIATLEKIFGVQRSLLEKYSAKPASEIPQIFCAYKEVLDDYRGGLKVPDDVTVVLPDDNFGYIRYFPTATEQKRKGGSGVYYHISYLGRPLSYLWLNTTPPGLIFEEMSKAYANGMRDFWMLNVGDLKPGEIGIELFMQMAYDSGRWTIENQHEFLEDFARREFGDENAKEIASVLDEYYRLNFQRKPEHLQWYLPKTEARPSELAEKEKKDRIAAFERLALRADDLYVKFRGDRRELYELVVYPVRMSAAANVRFFATELALDAQARAAEGQVYYARLAFDAERRIAQETKYFNETLAGGKWNGVMSPEMTPGQWPSFRTTPPRLNASNFSMSALQSPDPPSETPAPADPSIAIEAENFTKNARANGFSWRVVKGLGKTGDSVTVFPNAAKTFEKGRGPRLDYIFSTGNEGEFTLRVNLIPTQPLATDQKNGLRFAVAIDDAPPVPMAATASATGDDWAFNVLNATIFAETKVKLTAGSHVLRLYAVDTGVVVDRLRLYRGELKGYF